MEKTCRDCMLTLGSLFDGAGTFPFAAQQCGVKAVWASEIESFPVEVTKKRFPEMKHLGDITKVDGAEIEPVDIITFGSPCQDLSVAGKRAGLDGERSGLFMEAVRIIKEMRCSTNGKYPAIAVWENVPGAFSSNKGEDFRTVLEELCKIKGSDTVIPQPPKRRGKPAWNDAGLILGDGFSIAWRVLDAQFWGVPQRRRRIFLVADFRGQCAGKILFEREGLSRSFAESRKAWKGITRSLACGSNAKEWDARGNGDGNIAPTITGDHNNRVTDYTTLCVRERCGKEGGGKGVLIQENKSGTISCNNDQFLVITGADLYNQALTEEVSMTLCAGRNDCQKVPCVIFAKSDSTYAEIIAMATQQGGAEIGKDLCLIGIDDSGIAQTLVAKGPGAVCYITGNSGDIAGTLDASYYKGCGERSGVEREFILCLSKCNVDLRRLTPTECGRLQGMPDWWCEDVPHSDSAEYKMWGNGMALPCVLYVMENVVKIMSKED